MSVLGTAAHACANQGQWQQARMQRLRNRVCFRVQGLGFRVQGSYLDG